MEGDKMYREINGKKFVLYTGLLSEFHKNGGKSIETKLIRTKVGEKTMFIFKAIVSGAKGIYTGYGDATVKNVNPMVAPHMMRMAETRAKARALRDYNNIGECSVEELGEDN